MDVFSMKPINEEKIKFILNLKRKGIRDKEVLKAMETIDRKIFLDGIFKSRSEDDIPLPISCGQTISQPSVVAKMIEKLETNKSCKVLEIGTGSGYLTAILSKLLLQEKFKSLPGLYCQKWAFSFKLPELPWSLHKA